MTQEACPQVSCSRGWSVLFKVQDSSWQFADEASLTIQAMAEWEEKEAERQAVYASVKGGMEAVEASEAKVPQFVAYVPLPDQKEIEQRVLDKKKATLLSKYTSEALLAEQNEAKGLLNKR